MLSEMIRRTLPEMTLGIRGHTALAVALGPIVKQVIQRDRECCHVCGSRIPGFMEIDHLRGHRPSKAEDLRAICQFCHNLRHPLWAASRKRILPITAPDMTQSDINRLAWVVLAWRGVEGSPIDAGSIIQIIEGRRKDFRERVGSDSAEILFEAVLTAASEDMLGEKRAARILTGIDQYLRFWPAELCETPDSLDPGSRLSTWGIGGFRAFADEAAEAIRRDQSPDLEVLRKAAEGAYEKKAGPDRKQESRTEVSDSGNPEGDSADISDVLDELAEFHRED